MLNFRNENQQEVTQTHIKTVQNKIGTTGLHW